MHKKAVSDNHQKALSSLGIVRSIAVTGGQKYARLFVPIIILERLRKEETDFVEAEQYLESELERLYELEESVEKVKQRALPMG